MWPALVIPAKECSGYGRTCRERVVGPKEAIRGVPTSSTVSRPSPQQGFGRLAVALASSGEVASRLETNLVLLTLASRALTVIAGILFGIVSPLHRSRFTVVALVIVAYAAFATWRQLRQTSLHRLRGLTLVELVVMVGGIMVSGG